LGQAYIGMASIPNKVGALPKLRVTCLIWTAGLSQ
jgi:hypothetical protein